MRVLGKIEIAFWVLAAAAFVYFNARRWAEGDYLRAALPLAAVLGVLAWRVVTAYRKARPAPPTEQP